VPDGKWSLFLLTGTLPHARWGLLLMDRPHGSWVYASVDVSTKEVSGDFTHLGHFTAKKFSGEGVRRWHRLDVGSFLQRIGPPPLAWSVARLHPRRPYTMNLVRVDQAGLRDQGPPLPFPGLLRFACTGRHRRCRWLLLPFSRPSSLLLPLQRPPLPPPP